MNHQEWLEVFRGIGAEMRAGLPAVLASEDRGTPVGRGAGGDRTFPVDQWAEKIVLTALHLLAEKGISR